MGNRCGMDDIDMTRAVGKAMGYQSITNLAYSASAVLVYHRFHQFIYDPLHNDQQAMELVKRFNLTCQAFGMANEPAHLWEVYAMSDSDPRPADAVCKDLNRAIVECVAKIATDAERSAGRTDQAKAE